MNFVSKAITVVMILLSLSILIGGIFSSNIRSNLAGLVSTLLSNGILGYWASLVLLNLYFPVYKFFKVFFEMRSIKKALDVAILKNKFEVWVGRIIYGIAPLTYITYITYKLFMP